MIQKSVHSLKVFFLFAVLVIYTGCATQKSDSPAKYILNDSDFIPKEFLWQPVANGIERFDFENHTVPLIYHAVKIDLSNENLELVCFPDSNTKTSSDGNFTGIKTSEFARKNDCVVAVNASPFEGMFKKKKIIGIHFFEGTYYSCANSKYGAIVFNKDSARIIENQNPDFYKDFDFAFGGFFVVLKSDEVQNSFAEIYNSRSGAGVSGDGKTLYLLVVEGEHKSSSLGLTYPQCGKIFKAMGCSDALELDGGGSTELCINGKSILSYKTTRIQANSFGFILKQ